MGSRGGREGGDGSAGGQRDEGMEPGDSDGRCHRWFMSPTL